MYSALGRAPHPLPAASRLAARSTARGGAPLVARSTGRMQLCWSRGSRLVACAAAHHVHWPHTHAATRQGLLPAARQKGGHCSLLGLPASGVVGRCIGFPQGGGTALPVCFALLAIALLFANALLLAGVQLLANSCCSLECSCLHGVSMLREAHQLAAAAA
ncbi:hypothetical protein Dimus_013017 [Dionaea muscipula]